MKARTEAEIKRQIEGIESEMSTVPAISGFGTPNHEVMDAQISILKGETTLYDYPFDSDDEENHIYFGAENAEMWLNGESEEDLFSE